MVNTDFITNAIEIGRMAEPEGAALVAYAIAAQAKPRSAVDYETALDAYASFFRAVSGYESHHQRRLVEAFLFAVACHRGQFYQWCRKTKLPYPYHLAATAKHVISFPQATPVTIIIALWHDILEDKKATTGKIYDKLEEKEQNHVLSALQLLDRGSYTGKQKTLLYYQNLCTHADALLVKIADLLANLDACLARFDEMKQDKTRFWIYSYVFQIERCLFPYLEQSPFLFSFLAKKRLSLRISALQGRFRERENDEYNQFAEAGIP